MREHTLRPVPAALAPDLDRTATEVMGRVARTFGLATRLLPATVRADVRRLYLVLRTIDDAVDEGRPGAADLVAAVERWAHGAPPSTPECRILEDLATRHPGLPRDAVRDFCAGMRADLQGPDHATDADLATYCYRVAGTVGRLMAAILGVHPGAIDEADVAARRLGAAMQRTNILRDLVEDARAGRVYLPAPALAELGVGRRRAATEIATLARWPARRRRALLEPLIVAADADYAAGLAGAPLLRSGSRAIHVAGRLYREILREIERDDYGSSGRRVVVPRRRKVAIVARTLLSAGD